jgi:hypothetical protein
MVGAQQHEVVYPAKSVRIVQTQTVVAEGKSNLKSIRQRLITTSGEWKETTFQLSLGDSLAPVSVYSNETGQYGVSREAESLKVIGNAAPSRAGFRSTKFLREHPEFVGEGELLGYKTFIFRVEMAPGAYLEKHFAPEVADIPIKLVKHDPKFDMVIEPVSIEFIEVTLEMIATPDLPISTDHLNCSSRLFDN